MDLQKIKLLVGEIVDTYNPEGLIPFPFANITAAKSELSILYSDQLKSDISGAIFLQDGRFTVLINANKPPVRQYFTVAHELGHYYLHRQWLEDNNASGFVDYSPTLDSDNMLLRPDEPTMASGVDLLKEREANNFAAALLMPEKEVRQVWKLTHSISECAKTFQVSTSAMAIRLERLGLQ